MKKIILYTFMIFAFLSPIKADEHNHMLNKYLTKDYIVIGPKKIKVEGDYLTYYQYPELKRLYIYDVEFLREIDGLKIFKGYIIKDKFTGKILILPVGEYHETKND
ncbi:hypothetical protein [Persephonella sp.]